MHTTHDAEDTYRNPPTNHTVGSMDENTLTTAKASHNVRFYALDNPVSYGLQKDIKHRKIYFGFRHATEMLTDF